LVFLFLCWLVFEALGFEFKTLSLLGKHSTTWAMSSVLVLLVCLLRKGFALTLPWLFLNWNPPTLASYVAGITGVCHHPFLILEMDFPFFPRWSLNSDPHVSTSQVAGITGHSRWLVSYKITKRKDTLPHTLLRRVELLRGEH
jgi:hypothetical protein